MGTNLVGSKELFSLLQKKASTKCRFSLSCNNGHTKEIWQTSIKNEQHVKLFYELMKRALDSLINGCYSDFDAQTTTNCCHGLAIFAKNLIQEVLELNLEAIRFQIEKFLSEDSSVCDHLSISPIPGAFIDIVSLYTLTVITEMDDKRGRLCFPMKLKSLSPCGTKFNQHLVKALQKRFSILISSSYSEQLENLNQEIHICNAPIKLWGKYIQSEFLREDNRGKKYASSLYSMMVSLAQIIQSQSKIAILNDVRDEDQNRIKREIYLLKGDGVDQLIPIDLTSYNFDENINKPIVIYAGCSISMIMDWKTDLLKLESWIPNFSSLILAGEIHYPQFPRVSDSEFNYDPIIPEEPLLGQILEQHSKVDGILPHEPSLFFLSHIFPASLKQVWNVFSKKNINDLPESLIPSNLI